MACQIEKFIKDLNVMHILIEYTYTHCNWIIKNKKGNRYHKRKNIF